jgi:TDG/mug DNA glycosylase family protein
MALTQKHPTREELQAARDNRVPDVIAPDLLVLFCGINPGLYSGYTRHHFARPGNRFWPTLYAAGFTPRLLKPEEERELLALGFGITNLVERATATAAELRPAELLAGGAKLSEKIALYRPAVVAILGVTAYRQAFKQPSAQLGRQESGLEGSELWILPNPSGLNAHYTPAALADVYRAFLSEVRGVP